MINEYSPDKWSIIEIESEDNITFHKVLGGWSGGYLDSDHYRLSSGLMTIEDGGDHWVMTNHSGSIYKCGKNSEGFTTVSNSVYLKMVKATESTKIKVSTISVDEFDNKTKEK